MDARLIPVVLPVAKKVIQLKKMKEEFERVDNCGEVSKKLIRYKERLSENIKKLEKELGYETVIHETGH
jgi:hypothetical protein